MFVFIHLYLYYVLPIQVFIFSNSFISFNKYLNLTLHNVNNTDVLHLLYQCCVTTITT